MVFENHRLNPLAQFFSHCISVRSVFIRGRTKKKVNVWFEENPYVLSVCLSVCLDRRLLCGLPGPHAQRRPLRSQKDVCQQRPGPECLQEGDHHHGENSDALFQASSLTSGCLILLVCRHLRQRAQCLKDSFAKWLTIKGLCYKILRRNNSVCLWLVIEPPTRREKSILQFFWCCTFRKRAMKRTPPWGLRRSGILFNSRLVSVPL